MALESDRWRVQGQDIVDGRGQPVRMRGLCLGGWMNMENFATGHPGNEAGLRRIMAEVLGAGRARFFFERFLDYFITEADLQYIASLGLNVVRVAFNYHHFESDDAPFQHLEEGFTRLDRLIGWAGKHHLHVIFDLHAAPGWQSPGWHCDNPGHRAHFWDHPVFQGRATALWKVLAERYRGETRVAGYNLLNEPVASPAQLPRLNHYYRKTTEVIRQIDPDAIIFLDGNHFGQRCDQLDPPYDGNTVYSYHFYPEPVLESGCYPVEIDGMVYDESWLEGVLLERTGFMREHHRPAWAGEFGAFFNGGPNDTANAAVIAGMIGIMERLGHHWTLWHYKDIGPMGVVTVDPASEWMERTRPVRALKSALRCDYWVERQPTGTSRLLDDLIRNVRDRVGSLPGNRPALAEELYAGVCQETLSQMLLPAFAEQFRKLNETEIDHLLQSFAFEKCVPRKLLVDVLRRQ